MEVVLESSNLTKRAGWLIRLRWLAVGFLAAATFGASHIMQIQLHEQALYTLALCIILYNSILHISLHRAMKYNKEGLYEETHRIIILQVSADLFILTAVLYFSGGVENPFSFFYVFHMIIASMLLSRRLSYLQATLAAVLFGLMIGLEYFGVLRHYSLEGFADTGQYLNGKYVLGVFFVVSATLYLVVYMSTTIVAQLRRQQAGYREANLQLEKKDRVKNEYILRVTHDIKGHLAAIKSCLDIISSNMIGPLNSRQMDLVERADRRSAKCIAFISALLGLTQMRLAGRIEMKEFSLKNAIYDALAAAEEKAEAKSIKVGHEIADSIDRIQGNGLLIEDTIANLLMNAVKYTPAGGEVKFVVRDEGETVVIEVIDTGIGIPQEELGKIFDEFYRASNAKKIERDGTGLGLSMAKEVIDRHGGRIWAESGNGGSKFSFSLPKVQKQGKISEA